MWNKILPITTSCTYVLFGHMADWLEILLPIEPYNPQLAITRLQLYTIIYLSMVQACAMHSFPNDWPLIPFALTYITLGKQKRKKEN